MSNTYGVPFVKSVFHPSDFSEASSLAFAHALAIALRRETKFTIMHAIRERTDDNWERFPAIRKTLQRWGMLEDGSSHAAIYEDLKLRVRKVNVFGRSAIGATLNYLEEHPTDLIVLATQGREGMPRWIRRSIAETIARRSKTMTLFVPEGGRGFISPDDGRMCLRRILIPIDLRPNPRAALVYAARVAQAAGEEETEVILLHIGKEGEAPDVELPDTPTVTWTRLAREGDAVDEALDEASRRDVDLVIMPTAGRNGIIDALRGSVTEQVVRGVHCPVLAVPAK